MTDPLQIDCFYQSTISTMTEVAFRYDPIANGPEQHPKRNKGRSTKKGPVPFG